MLYASHLGWLSSTVKYKQGKSEKSISKHGYYGEDALICRLPEIDEHRYFIEMWNSLGRYKSNGFGVEPVSWSEIKNFIDINQIAKWEAQLLHAMSKMFVDARNAFNDLYCEPPYLYGGHEFRQLSLQAASARRTRK